MIYIFLVLVAIWEMLILIPGTVFLIPYALLIFYVLFPIVSPIYAAYFFFSNSRRKPKLRFLSILLILPLATLGYSSISKDYSLNHKTPDNELIKSFIQGETAGTGITIELSNKVAQYHQNDKTLDLYLSIDPSKCMAAFESYNEHFRTDPESSAKILKNILYGPYIELPMHVSKVTRLPEKITVYGYWGETPLFKAYYQKEHKAYRLVEPYPQVWMVGNEDKWSFEYQLEGLRKDIFIADVPNSNFRLSLLP